MRNLKRIIGSLVIMSGIGHIFLAVAFDNQSMFTSMVAGGILYLILGALVWRNSNKALIVSTSIMLIATIVSSQKIHDVGYPAELIMCFLVLNCVVVLLSGVYFYKDKVLARTN